MKTQDKLQYIIHGALQDFENNTAQFPIKKASVKTSISVFSESNTMEARSNCRAGARKTMADWRAYLPFLWKIWKHLII